ncbi:flagellar filament capping protein FliD [Pseudoalteromonas luteoviolacea]|uniref:Flagellar hook-associated protein 2 n=1 Tax=Pseudoalteromonas luteoviolacea H33 TaxID=1365251 RepID=A0A162ABR8_9GAMM|nr:flagellar filament capping protein FliD [Pseudoalteromonas luteoviolacea]KZN47203.1 flagellar cap protein [Pseudoalteromonas luteoviolacea H33]KZN77181.1 flagellar cap protein [Pseudoalteromonas luteoviolacea H33-S]MBQ4879334.1 flagellar filament capping protein FliD [Pseudoalteromonas luteoviolacea]MBQ4908394.1 flagellar filament capping protein FliD [Pseudoalteromonas luteoviolacea]
MPLITSAGVGSGLDLESIIKASVDAENRPKMQQFAIKDERLSVELSAIGEVKSALSTLNDTVEKLADIDNFNKRVANITQPTSGDIISVTPTSDISVGNFDIAVQQLAQGSRAVSTDGAFDNADSVVSASGGTLSFAAGSKSFDLSVTAGMTLNELRDAINADENNFGLTANIVNTGISGVGSKLVLTSSVTGSSNNLVITSDTAEMDALETYDDTLNPTGGMIISADDEAKDAIISIDGLLVNSETNTFKDAVQDMTITAKAKSVQDSGGEYETAKLNIDYDRESVNTLIDELITNYNAVIGQIGFRTRIGEPLNGDSSMRSLDDQLISALSTSLTDAGPFESIFDIGLGVDDEGYLEKSSLVRSLNEAMDSNFDDIGTAFAGENGVAKQLESLLGNYVDSSGILKQREDSLNGQIKELEEDVLNHEYRMASLEDRLRKQYAGLDVLIAQMQQTQNYLGAQLANLPGFTSKK